MAFPGRVAPAWSVFAAFVCLCALTLGRGFYSSDGEVMFQTTAALVEQGTLALPPDPGLPQIIEGRDGRFYSKYDPGLPLLAVPFYLAGDRLAAINQAHRTTVAALTVSLLPALAAASTLALLLALASRLAPPGDNRPLLLTIAAGLGTPLWWYGRTLFPEALLACTLTAAVTLTVYAADRPARLILAGVALGIGMLTRAALAIYALPLVILTLRIGPRRTKRLIGIALGLAPFAAGILLHNVLRFGNPLSTGYRGEVFSTPPWQGIAGLLFSPGKGLWFYAPPLLLSAVLWPRFRRKQPALATFLALAWIVALAFYGSWWAWDGGWAWGPRLLVPLLPLSCLPLLALPLRRSWLIAAALTIGWGALVNMLGVLTDPVTPYARLAARFPDPAMRAAFSVTDSPVIGALRLLAEGQSEPLALFHLAATGLPLTWQIGAPALALGGLLAGTWGMWQTMRRVHPSG
jgi:4-amino-4-deoxy-L-arabinose transferase-like glycosyltransferase